MENYGIFLDQFCNDTKKLIREFERIKINIDICLDYSSTHTISIPTIVLIFMMQTLF